jgi:hypothetical protein
MDADRFDALSRSLSAARSRRSALSALLGTLLGTTLLRSAAEDLAAVPKKKGKDHVRRSHGRGETGHDRDADKDPAKQWQSRKRGRQPNADDKSTGEPAQNSALLESKPVSSAACRRHGKPCEKGRQCCSRTCSRRNRCVCPSGTTKCGTKNCCETGQQGCVNGSCTSCVPGATNACYTGPTGTEGTGVCKGGTSTCGNDGTVGPCEGEVTPSSDVCDGLDNDCDGVTDMPDSCGGDKICRQGNCVCPDDRPDECSNQCVDTETDSANCGFCGEECSAANATTECINGNCTLTACDPGFADCNGNVANGCETDTRNDNVNCGGCGIPCLGEKTCQSGQCRCPVGTADCNGDNVCETGLGTSDNCADCNDFCAAPKVCRDSQCQCPLGEKPCGGGCINETSCCSAVECPQPANATATCFFGACGFVCNEGYTKCGDACCDS